MTTSTFSAIRLSGSNSSALNLPQQLTLHDLDEGNVVIQVAYSSVNYKDALAVTARGEVIRRFPCIPGIDLAGEVTASSDAGFAPGQKVLATGYGLGVSHHGGYAEYARLPAAWLVPLPQELSLFEAMTLGTAGFTAALAVLRLEHLAIRPDSGPVVVTGSTGGVGALAVSMLARKGYEVIAVSGKPEQEACLRRWGARAVLPRPALEGEVKPLGKATWAAAIDNVGGPLLPWLLSAIKPGGAVASVGNAAGAAFAGSVYPFILRGVSLLGIDSVNCPAPLRRSVWEQLATSLRPPILQEIAQTIPLAEVPKACQRLIEGRSTGRVVVRLRA